MAVGLAAAFVLRREGGPSFLPPFEQVRIPRGDVVVSYPDEPLTLNPYLHSGNTNATRDLLRPVLPTLLAIGPDLKYRPALAKKVPSGSDVKSNPFSVTFDLDPEARWSDGIPITADDVRFTWETIKEPKWPVADRSGYDRLTDVVVVDRNTVRLVFSSPYPAWRELFSAGDFVLPRHALMGKDFAVEMSSSLPFSGGPFQIQSFTPGLEIVYALNPRWWGPSPLAERVKVQFVPDVETALQLLQQRRIDVLVSTSQINLTRRIQMKGAEANSRFGSAWWELAFNHSKQGVRELGWREAVATGFDRAGIVEAIVRREGRALDHLSPGRSLPPAFAQAAHDPAASRQRLATAGYIESGGTFSKRGIETIQISSPSESEIATVVERAVQVGLGKTGLQLEIANPRSQMLYGQWRIDGKFDLAVWERRGSPGMAISGLFRSTLHPPAGVNYYRLSSAETDTILDSGEQKARDDLALLSEGMASLAATLPALPLFEAKAYVGFRRGVIGPDPNATVDGPFWNLGDWAVRS